MEEDKYSLLFPNEDEKNNLLYKDSNDKDPEHRNKVVLLLSILATKSSKYLFQLYQDEFVVSALQDFDCKVISAKTNPVICTFTNAAEAIKAVASVFSTIHEFNSERTEVERCEVQAAIHYGQVMEIENDIMGEVINTATKIHSVVTANLIFLSAQVFEDLKAEQKNCFFVGGFHFKGSIEPTQIFGYTWLPESEWLEECYQNQMDILLEGDPNRYKIIQKDLHEQSAFKPLAPFTLETIPTGAQVWLNEIPIHQTTPFTLNHKIGDFLMRVKKKGYQTVEKKIQILQGEENTETLQLKSILGSISIEPEIPECTIYFNGKKLNKKTPHHIEKLMPDAYSLELVSKTHYTDSETIELHDSEHYIYKPKMKPYAKLVILSKIKDVEFLIKDAETGEKLKTNEDTFSYAPKRKYKEGVTEAIKVKEGKYKIEPLDNRYSEVEVEVKSGELELFDYDKYVEKKTVIINTGNYQAKVKYKHNNTGEKGVLSVKGRRKVKFVPGNITLHIESKIAEQKYNIDLFKDDVKIHYANDILPIAKERRNRLVKKIAVNFIFFLLLIFGLYSYLQLDSQKWQEVKEKDDLFEYVDYLHTFYLFRHNKKASEMLQNEQEQFWQLCKERNAAQHYETYLSFYDEPKYEDEAREKHYHLLWEEAMQSDRPDLYKLFMKMYPNSPLTMQADSLFQASLWKKYKEKNSMVHFTYYLWKYPASDFLEEAKLQRENVFFSMSTPEFWLDKWHDIRDFFLAKDNLFTKFVLLGISIIVFLIVYFKKRSVKVN